MVNAHPREVRAEGETRICVWWSAGGKCPDPATPLLTTPADTSDGAPDSGGQIPSWLVARLRRHGLLGPLLRRELVAETVVGITLPEEQLQLQVGQYLRQNKLETPEALAAHLREQGMLESDLRWQLELPLRVQLAARERFLDQAEKRFLERKQALDQVTYSLLRVKDAFLARELYLQVNNGESDFGDLAVRYSEGPERESRGIVGPKPLVQAHPQLRERLRSCRPGELLEPFAIEQWWLLVRLEESRPATFSDAVATQMCVELFDQSINEETMRRLQALTGQPENNS